MEQYITFITAVLIAVAWICGFNYTFKEGEIFGKPGQWMRTNLPEWFNNPTFDCVYCMSSVHGSAFFLLLLWGWPWYWWVIYCFVCCGTTAIFDNK
jgi:hypothetical protein